MSINTEALLVILIPNRFKSDSISSLISSMLFSSIFISETRSRILFKLFASIFEIMPLSRIDRTFTSWLGGMIPLSSKKWSTTYWISSTDSPDDWRLLTVSIIESRFSFDRCWACLWIICSWVYCCFDLVAETVVGPIRLLTLEIFIASSKKAIGTCHYRFSKKKESKQLFILNKIGIILSWQNLSSL